VLRGLTSLFIGLVLGFIGIDGLSGQARLTFGIRIFSTASMSSSWPSACYRRRSADGSRGLTHGLR
jgi:hypothetical protein